MPMGTSHLPFRLLMGPKTEGEMHHQLRPRETTYMWAAAGVSIAVIFAMAAL